MSTAASGSKWQYWLLAAGGAVAAGGVMYYLLREDSSTERKSSTTTAMMGSKRKLNIGELSKEDVLAILQDISKSQDEMKLVMKELTHELIANNYNFQDTYNRVRQVQPDDPLERHGVSMQEFDHLLEKFQNETSVREAISRIMGAPDLGNTSAKAHSVSKETIVQVHEYMLEQLKLIVDEFEKLPSKSSFEMKTVTIAAQALVGAKVESKFSLTSDDIESAVLLHHQALSTDPEFARINVQMQTTMTALMGSHFPAGFM